MSPRPSGKCLRSQCLVSVHWVAVAAWHVCHPLGSALKGDGPSNNLRSTLISTACHVGKPSHPPRISRPSRHRIHFKSRSISAQWADQRGHLGALMPSRVGCSSRGFRCNWGGATETSIALESLKSSPNGRPSEPWPRPRVGGWPVPWGH